MAGRPAVLLPFDGSISNDKKRHKEGAKIRSPLRPPPSRRRRTPPLRSRNSVSLPRRICNGTWMPISPRWQIGRATSLRSCRLRQRHPKPPRRRKSPPPRSRRPLYPLNIEYGEHSVGYRRRIAALKAGRETSQTAMVPDTMPGATTAERVAAALRRPPKARRVRGEKPP